MNFTKANTMMKTARNGKRKLANNTYLEKTQDGYGVRLHNTIIVEIHADDTYTLDNGGWQTVTTKSRINEFSPVRLHSDKGRWCVGQNLFVPGMKIDANGTPLNPTPIPPKVRKPRTKPVTPAKVNSPLFS